MNRFWITLLAFSSALTPLFSQPHDHLADTSICKKGILSILQRNGPDLNSGAGEQYDLKYHRCYWELDPGIHYIHGAVTSWFAPREDNLSQIEFDLSLNLQVDSVWYHGQKTSFQHDQNDLLVVSLPTPLPAQTLDSVTIFYQGAPQTGQGFGSFVTAQHNNTPVLWTLSEPYGAKEWWPCKQSLSDKADSIDIIVRTPEAYKVASIGLLQSVTQDGAYRIHHWHSKYPIAAYLVAVAITNYVEYSDYVPIPGGQIEVLNYVYPENLGSAMSESGAIVEMMQLFNEKAGLYPFYEEKYGHANFGFGGGMEHQTMSFMVNFGYGLMAHELAHQWFGDKITCGSWQDIWLNEGFATYFEGLTREAYFSENTWYNWKLGKHNSAISAPDGSVFVPDTTDIYRIFSGRLSYNKGAYLLHMLRWMLGDDDFFQGIYQYANDPDLAYGYARTADLQAHLESASGKDLTGFFDQWYYGEGYPTYQLYWIDNKGFIEGWIEQTTSAPQSVAFFDIPVPLYIPSLDTTIALQMTSPKTYFSWFIGPIDTIEIDPDLWILSGASTSTQLPSSVGQQDDAPEIRIFPNPVEEFLYVSLSDWPGEGDLEIVDALGRVRASYSLDRARKEFPAGHLAPGWYVVRIRGNGWSSRPVTIWKQ